MSGASFGQSENDHDESTEQRGAALVVRLLHRGICEGAGAAAVENRAQYARVSTCQNPGIAARNRRIGRKYALARDYLQQHPLGDAEKAQIAEAAAMMANASKDGQNPNPPPADELAQNMEERTILDREFSLRFEAWRQSHARSGAILLKFLILPLLGVFAFYHVSIPVVRWVLAGRTA